MILKIKPFEELTTRELYEILKLRSAVFIVEQQGQYLDLDDVDYDSLHIFYEDEAHHVCGCLRMFPKQDEPGTIQLGRIVTRERRTGLGSQLIRQAIAEAKNRFHADRLYLTGRKSALEFYLHCGFEISSPEHHAEAVPYYEFRRSI